MQGGAHPTTHTPQGQHPSCQACRSPPPTAPELGPALPPESVLVVCTLHAPGTPTQNPFRQARACPPWVPYCCRTGLSPPHPRPSPMALELPGLSLAVTPLLPAGLLAQRGHCCPSSEPGRIYLPSPPLLIPDYFRGRQDRDRLWLPRLAVARLRWGEHIVAARVVCRPGCSLPGQALGAREPYSPDVSLSQSGVRAVGVAG